MRFKLFIVTVLLIFSLSACIGNYRTGYVKYSKKIKDYELYYMNLDDEDAECPTDGLFLLYEEDGNSYMYEGMKTSNDCRTQLMLDTGLGFITIDKALKDKDITVEEINAVNWTFDLTIDQTPDYTFSGLNFIEYFERIGGYYLYIIDYGNQICHDTTNVFLYEFNDEMVYVDPVITGDGCVSEYYIYYDEDDTDEEDGVMLTVNEALLEDLISISSINITEFESPLYTMHQEDNFLAVSATITFSSDAQTYNLSNPYTLTIIEKNYVMSEISSFLFYNDISYVEGEAIVATLTLYNAQNETRTYELYNTGIRIDDLDAYQDYNNQTYIKTLLDSLKD